MIQITSLPQFNSVVSFRGASAANLACSRVSLALHIDQWRPRRLHLLLGLLVWALPRHDSNLQRLRGLRVIPWRRLLQGRHRPRTGRRSARRRSNCAHWFLIIDHRQTHSDICWCTQIPGFYAYRRGQKLGELIGAYPDRLQVCTRHFFYCRRDNETDERTRLLLRAWPPPRLWPHNLRVIVKRTKSY
jgi:hypothetical protein